MMEWSGWPLLMLKTKQHPTFKTKCSQKHAVNFILNSDSSEKNGAKKRRNFSLCTRIIKAERNKNSFVGWGPSMALLLSAREGELLSLDSHLTACLSIYNLLQIIFNIKTLFCEELCTLALYQCPFPLCFYLLLQEIVLFHTEREDVNPKSWTMPGVCKAAIWGTGW